MTAKAEIRKSLLCRRCGRKLSKKQLEARKRHCYPCQCTIRMEQKVKAHDRSIESEDFTREDYWLLYQEQGGRCAIWECRATGKSRRLAVEHDHKCDMGHDPKRWCRACVRGLVCAMHNEWIGRSGDNPKVFDSIADYLREPPARTIMEKQDQGDTVDVLVRKYDFLARQAVRILDLARGVGPSPQKVTGGTITVRYTREPNRPGMYEIAESLEPGEPGGFRISGQLALTRLTGEFGLPEDKARNALNIAWEFGDKAEPLTDGYVHIWYHGPGETGNHLYTIKDHTGKGKILKRRRARS
jgi:hypothetical protein